MKKLLLGCFVFLMPIGCLVFLAPTVTVAQVQQPATPQEQAQQPATPQARAAWAQLSECVSTQVDWRTVAIAESDQIKALQAQIAATGATKKPTTPATPTKP